MLVLAEREVDLARRAVSAGDELPADDQARPESSSHRDKGEVLDPAADATPALADGGEIDVVLRPTR